MKAMIFAAGVGSRLRPFTLEHPKALAPVGGRPILERVVRNVVAAGAEAVVVNVHHFADQVKDFLAGEDFGVPVSVSDESALLLDTGGGVLKARPLLDGDAPFLVHNADILTDVDLADMYRQHCESGADVTLLATPRKTSRYLYFSPETGRLLGWSNDKTGETRPTGFVPDAGMLKLAFGGIHVISPSVFDVLAAYAPADTPFSTTPFYVDNISTLNIQAYTPHSGFTWCDIGTPESLQRANTIIENGLISN